MAGQKSEKILPKSLIGKTSSRKPPRPLIESTMSSSPLRGGCHVPDRSLTFKRRWPHAGCKPAQRSIVPVEGFTDWMDKLRDARRPVGRGIADK
jgi:hypothetical protein